MKTAGQLLKEKRLEKELSIEEIGKKLKVGPQYLSAVEANDYNSLPGATFVKGILRNYARVLYLNEDTIVAMFRRDFAENKDGAIIPKGALAPVARSPHIISANFLIAIVTIFVFCLFMIWQIISWMSLPKLDVTVPENGEVYVGNITVRGTTDEDAVITINNQKVLVDSAGNFTLELSLPPGTHSLLIQAESRSGKLRLVEKTFQITE